MTENEEYEKKLKKWEEFYKKKKPIDPKLLSDWEFRKHMMKPNKPGYYRANND